MREPTICPYVTETNVDWLSNCGEKGGVRCTNDYEVCPTYAVLYTMDMLQALSMMDKVELKANTVNITNVNSGKSLESKARGGR